MQITIPVHNLSRRILIKEYNTEPIKIERHDTLFVVLSALRSERMPITRAKELLCAEITVDVNARLARYIQGKPHTIGFALLKYHKETIHRHVASVMQYTQKASAWNVLKAYLDYHEISEDDYPMETAYKNWQRFGWFFQKKNGQKRGHLRRETGVKAKKMATPVSSRKTSLFYRVGPKPCEPIFSVPELDLLAAAASGSISAILKELPSRFPEWVRHYTYIYVGHHSKRTAARALGVSPQTVYRGYCAIRKRKVDSPLFARLLADTLPAAP